MCVIPHEMTAGDVLSAFHRDAPYLFLGAAFVAVGLVSAAFAAIRRKYDILLIYFALFAAFYGLSRTGSGGHR
jgi:phosphoserine phosphatase RsbU/P